MKKFYLLFFLSGVVLSGLNAQPFSLVKDIASGSANGLPKQSPFVSLGGYVYFVADDGTNGQELWRSKGKLANTEMVKDINPGSAGGGAGLMTKAGNKLFFTASDGVHGRELWVTDGTNSGTVLVKDIVAGSGTSNVRNLIGMGGILYFVADDGVNGFELWKSDGTDSGTVMVKDIQAGSGDGMPDRIEKINGVLYFSADDGIHGREYWKSDGTTAGTVLVKDLESGAAPSDPESFVNAGGNIYIIARSSVGLATRLWVSDGTAAGTHLLLSTPDVDVISAGIGLHGKYIFPAVHYMSAGHELWESDGTVAGTQRLTDKNPGTGSFMFGRIIKINGVGYFVGNDGTNGEELWKTDGTDSGTVMVKDITPGAGSSAILEMIEAGDLLIFTADEGVHGFEIWASDGTETGTALVQDIRAGSNGSQPRFTAYNDNNERVFFGATTDAEGTELWSAKLADIADSLAAQSLNARSVSSKAVAFSETNEKQQPRILLYPNPAPETARLLINSPKAATISYSIVDMNGRTIQQRNIAVGIGANIITIQTGSLPTGIYSVVVKGENTVDQLKFVK